MAHFFNHVELLVDRSTAGSQLLGVLGIEALHVQLQESGAAACQSHLQQAGVDRPEAELDGVSGLRTYPLTGLRVLESPPDGGPGDARLLRKLQEAGGLRGEEMLGQLLVDRGGPKRAAWLRLRGYREEALGWVKLLIGYRPRSFVSSCSQVGSSK